MKIFVLTPLYPSIENSSSGIFVHQINKALIESGHDITVICSLAKRYDQWLHKNFGTTNYYELDNIPVYSNNYRGFMTSKFPRIAVNSCIKRLRPLFEEAKNIKGKPDLIFGHFTFPSGYGALLLSKENGVPLIVLEHHSLFLQNSLHPYIQKVLSKVVNESNTFICVSDHLKNAICRWVNPSNDIEVIPNLLDDRFSYKPMPPSNPFVFFSAGNLVKSKNFKTVISAFCKAFNEDEPVNLKIAGDGPEKNKIKKQINDCGRKNQIHLLGRLGQELMAQNYQNSHCFILLSKYETFGIVYREAMAVGRPVISSCNGGIMEGWCDEFGILVNSNDVEGCKNAMQLIRADFDNYNSFEISNKIQKTFSKVRFQRQMSSVFNHIF